MSATVRRGHVYGPWAELLPVGSTRDRCVGKETFLARIVIPPRSHGAHLLANSVGICHSAECASGSGSVNITLVVDGGTPISEGQ